MLRKYVAYYNPARCHQLRGGDAPEPRHVEDGPERQEPFGRDNGVLNGLLDRLDGAPVDHRYPTVFLCGKLDGSIHFELSI